MVQMMASLANAKLTDDEERATGARIATCC
jgi:hypothetical protein